MQIAKALVLAGSGPQNRPWPSVRSMPKALVPVANRPILFHNLEALRTADYATPTKLMDPKVFNGATTQGLKRLHAVLDRGAPLEVAVAGVWFQNSAATPEEPRRVKLTYQIHFPNRWKSGSTTKPSIPPTFVARLTSVII